MHGRDRPDSGGRLVEGRPVAGVGTTEEQQVGDRLEVVLDPVTRLLRQRSLELNEVNAFLETILSTMGVAVIVVDRDQRVQIWNRESADLWGVRSDEAEGQHLFGLDIGLPLENVRAALRGVLSGSDERAEMELEALNRRGRSVRVAVTLLPIGFSPGDVSGAVVLTAPVDGAEPPSGDGG